MAREAIFIDELTQANIPTTEFVYSTHADTMVDILVEILRETFERHPIYTYIANDDTYSPDFENTKIVIVDRYSEEALFLPVVTVGIGSINTKWLQFSQSPFNTVLKYQLNRDGSIKKDARGRAIPSHWEYTGAYEGSVNLVVNANDTLEREELCNLIHVLLAEVLRDKLYQRGLFIKNVSVGGQTEIQYRNTNIYQSSITLETYSEWARKIPLGETLESVGFSMNIITPEDAQVQPEATIGPPIPIYSLDNEYYVIDPATSNPVIPDLQLSATSSAAPVCLVFDNTSLTWKVSSFWQLVLQQTLIPFSNLMLDLNKTSKTETYLKQASEAVIQAIKLRTLSLTRGRTMVDGTKVLQNAFVFSDGRVELRGGIYPQEPLIYSTIVESNNDVIFGIGTNTKTETVLVVKNLVLDQNNEPTSGQVYRRYTDNLGQEQDQLLTSLDEKYLDGENYTSMSATDLFMIMQFASQPFRFSLSVICDVIDDLTEQLSDNTVSISFRTQKISAINLIKQDLLRKSEKFLLSRPVGLQ